MSSFHQIKNQIALLKKEKGAVILAHYYQLPEIQDLADHVGDSFALSRLAAELPQPVIVFCGVSFMADTAKILSPEKTVIIPDASAGCPMADMATEKDVVKLKEEHPDAAVVSYVNSSTSVKAHSDICCTSSNAEKVIRSLPHKKIIFLPDQNLGSFVAERVKEKEFIIFDGNCPIHHNIGEADVTKAKEQYPEALLVAHPECKPEVRKHAAFTGSTAQIIDYVAKSNHHTFLIGTEMGILHTLQNENPQKKLVSLTPDFICPDMKKITPEQLLYSLQHMKEQVELDPELIRKARVPLYQMLDASK